MPVFLPELERYDKVSHTINEVAKGLAALPKAVFNRVVSVNVNRGDNPRDADFAKMYNIPDFTSYMSTGINGVVEIYPQKKKPPQQALDASFVHETGHILS